MASGRPIVSTAVPDVVRNFGSVVKIGRDPDQFVELCREQIEAPDRAAVQNGLRMASENSWDSIVARLEEHVSEALRATPKQRATRRRTAGVAA